MIEMKVYFTHFTLFIGWNKDAYREKYTPDKGLSVKQRSRNTKLDKDHSTY